MGEVLNTVCVGGAISRRRKSSGSLPSIGGSQCLDVVFFCSGVVRLPLTPRPKVAVTPKSDIFGGSGGAESRGERGGMGGAGAAGRKLSSSHDCWEGVNSSPPQAPSRTSTELLKTRESSVVVSSSRSSERFVETDENPRDSTFLGRWTEDSLPTLLLTDDFEAKCRPNDDLEASGSKLPLEASEVVNYTKNHKPNQPIFLPNAKNYICTFAQLCSTELIHFQSFLI